MFYGIDILQHNKFYEEKFKNDVSQKKKRLTQGYQIFRGMLPIINF